MEVLGIDAGDRTGTEEAGADTGGRLGAGSVPATPAGSLAPARWTGPSPEEPPTAHPGRSVATVTGTRGSEPRIAPGHTAVAAPGVPCPERSHQVRRRLDPDPLARDPGRPTCDPEAV